MNTQAGASNGLNSSMGLGGTPLTQVSTQGSAGSPLLASANLAAGQAATWVSTSATLTQATSLAGDTITINVTNPGTGAAASYVYTGGVTGANTVAGLMGYINAQTGVTASGAATSALTISGKRISGLPGGQRYRYRRRCPRCRRTSGHVHRGDSQSVYLYHLWLWHGVES